MARALETHTVEAYNTAKQSENRIHDDTVARRFGFVGGLVPGVDVMAYMIHLPVARWGRPFLERGLIEARFIKPVYDGDTAEVQGAELDGELAIDVRSRGVLCTTGSASLPPAAPVVSLADYRDVGPVAERKPVSASSFAVGEWLGTAPRIWPGPSGESYRADIRESDSIYAREGLGHPGLLQKVMNRLLVDNVILGPWIHVGSRMQILSALQPDDEITARAKVIENYEKKGHRFVELDALVIANGVTPLAHCHHVAIVQPRAVAEV